MVGTDGLNVPALDTFSRQSEWFSASLFAVRLLCSVWQRVSLIPGARWRQSVLAKRKASARHANVMCKLLNIVKPVFLRRPPP